MDMESEEGEAIQLVISRLKPYCLDLLDLLRNPKKDVSFLREMADFLRSAPAAALQASLEFALLPFGILLDAAVQCRKENKVEPEEGFWDGGAPFGGAKISDAAAEGMLLCLEELLKKCPMRSVDQMAVVIKKLTHGALLSPSEASEEFREGMIRCFRAMLLALQPCSTSFCPCKQRFILPTVESMDTSFVPHSTPLSYTKEPQECLLAFLQSRHASAMVGHWLFLLLQAADFEALRGHRGSANLRKEAFLTLRVLVSKVGTADALAFFLPGVASGVAKALYLSKDTMSGAAGSTGALEQALRGFTEFLIIVLDDKANSHAIGMPMNDVLTSKLTENNSTQTVLEALRSLPFNSRVQSVNMIGCSSDQSVIVSSSMDDYGEKMNDNGDGKRNLFVNRSKEWIVETSSKIDKFISVAFPRLCVHPAEKIRKALVDGIGGLLSNCRCTLERSKLMLLECLCVLVCDDAEVVSMSAQESLESLFGLGEKFVTNDETSEIFMSLVKGLPRVVLGSEETVALVHAKKLHSLLYYAGPDLLVNNIFHSSVNAPHLLECLELCFSQNSRFAGSMNKILSSKPLSTGYLLSIVELKAGNLLTSRGHSSNDADLASLPKISILQNPSGIVDSVSEFPHMPPWFGQVGSQKLYLTLAGILRLIGRSLISRHENYTSLSVVVDQLLDNFRRLISELRTKEYGKEDWRSWYHRNGSGQLLRRTSVAVCMLNEIIYGLSEQSVCSYSELFKKSSKHLQEKTFAYNDGWSRGHKCQSSTWKIRVGKDGSDYIVLSIGKILHEYLSSVVWDIPLDQHELLLDEVDSDLPLHFFRDTIMLHQEIQQVILDGIGIFGILLGKEFVRSGLLQSSLYLLLRNLICSNSEIRTASDAVLRVLSVSSGYATVGEFVVANADYIIDSLCHQLRYLDINFHVPDVLAAMLSYIGAAHDILPLLEEPMRAVSSELEILGRHQHPKLTIPFLKAVHEISKASKTEASSLPDQAESFYTDVRTKVLTMQRWINENHVDSSFLCDKSLLEKGSVNFDNIALRVEYWEELMFRLNEMKRHRRMVGSLVDSCLKAATPLISSHTESACLLALDIIEDVSVSLAKVEEAYKHEKQTKAAIAEAIQLLSLNDLKDDIEAEDEEVDENRVLPAMNKIWPYLILCLKNKVTVAAIRRCLTVLQKAVQIGGGDFFVRRFHNDGHTIWKLLASFPFRRKQMLSDDKRILLPYRDGAVDEPMAEISNQKIQVSVLDMIAMLCSNKRTSSALQTVLKKVSGIVVGVACSSLTGLRDSSLGTLSALARIDPDLIWLLLADVYYSLNKSVDILPPNPNLAGLSDLLPASLSSKEYLFAKYAGDNFGFDIDSSSVEMVFRKMESEIFL